MHAGQGVPETFMGWGDRLLARYHKPRPEPNSSVSLKYIGYSSTGSYFCTPSRRFPRLACAVLPMGDRSSDVCGLRADAHRKNETYAETLLAAKAYGESQGIPYKWMLIDSWWYFEGAVPG